MPGNDGIQNNQKEDAKEAQKLTAHFIIIVEGEEGITTKQIPIVEFASGPMKTTGLMGIWKEFQILKIVYIQYFQLN
jgi:hypothetical protein